MKTTTRHLLRAAALAIAARYPKDAKVTVYYRPDKPAVALLEPGVPARAWLVLLAGVVFLAAGVILHLTSVRATSAPVAPVPSATSKSNPT